MEEKDLPAPSRFDPRQWTFHVRRTDGTWLARPAREADEAASNAPTWTRRIPDCWSFQSEREARDAAVSHGVDQEGFAVIPQPRRPGEWLAAGRHPIHAA